MTTRRSALMTLTMAAVLLPLGLVAHAQKSEEQAIKTAYSTADAYYRKKDAGKLMKMLAPDVSYKEVSGKTMNYKEMDAMMRQQMGMIQSIDTFKTTVKKLTVNGKMALAETSMTMKGKIKDPQGKMHTISSLSTTRDTWTKTAQGWRIKHIDTITDKSMMDGKPVGQ